MNSDAPAVMNQELANTRNDRADDGNARKNAIVIDSFLAKTKSIGGDPNAVASDVAAAVAGARLTIERGTFADYESLARFHYKGRRPGAITAVYRLTHRAPTVVGRYLKRGDETQIIGVLVRSLPQLSCRLRDVATGDRYRGLSRRDAAVMLNREVRTISRVVIDPQWRGLGLAVSLVKHALGECEPGVRYTEALAAMGRVSPFFEQAGMIRYDRPFRARTEHARLVDALRELGIEAVTLASLKEVRTRLGLDAVDGEGASDGAADRRAFLLRELRRWHRTAHRMPKREAERLSLEELLTAAREELLCQPVYYIYQHI